MGRESAPLGALISGSPHRTGRALSDHPDQVSLPHLNGDPYSSAVTVREHVVAGLLPGSVVTFDEFIDFPGWEQHESVPGRSTRGATAPA